MQINTKNHQSASFQSVLLPIELKKRLFSNRFASVGNWSVKQSHCKLTPLVERVLLLLGWSGLLKIINVEMATEPQCLHILGKSM